MTSLTKRHVFAYSGTYILHIRLYFGAYANTAATATRTTEDFSTPAVVLTKRARNNSISHLNKAARFCL